MGAQDTESSQDNAFKKNRINDRLLYIFKRTGLEKFIGANCSNRTIGRNTVQF